MDSRIREIEQWVAEAKANLGECGRDAYINKLYLLDAEIKAVIRENGIPAATSPRQPEGRVRRPLRPILAVAGTLGVLFLLATTVYLAVQPIGRAAGPALYLQAESGEPDHAAAVQVIGYVPDFVPGEELMTADWKPPEAQPPVAALPGVPAPAVDPQPVVQPPLTVAGIVAPAAASVLPPADGNGLAAANLAVDLVAVVPVGNAAPAAVGPAVQPASGDSSASFLGSQLEYTVAAKFSYFPESGTEPETPVNETMRQLGNQLHQVQAETNSVDNVDSSDTAEGDSVDNSEPELDSSALAEFLEQKISQHSKR